MAEYLDMSLDAIIQRNMKSCRGGRGGGRGGGGGGDYGVGPVRRFRNDVKIRNSPYFTPQVVDQKQMQPILVATSDANSETKLYISNLDYGVTNEDIKVLFSEVGVLKRYSIHYDKSGRSKGTAEVVFARQSDALDAVRRFNNVHLDGKPMRIEMVGLVTPGAIAVPPTSNDKNQDGAFRRQEKNERNAGRGWDGGGGGRRGRGSVRGRGRGRGRSEMSTADLDADLEKYHKDAMETN